MSKNPLRWPIVRHVRWLFWTWRLNRFLAAMRAFGLGCIPQQSDLDHLDRIRRGEA